LACFITQTYAQVNCAASLSCGDCTNISITARSCGWCASNKRCYAGNAAGPNITDPSTPPYCDVGWIYLNSDCEDECKILAQDCFDCQSIKHINCVWTKQNQCRLNGTIDPAYISPTCSCGMYHTCRECNAHKAGNCSYCPQKNACFNSADGLKNNCTFRLDGTCPCNVTYSCFECLENDNCGWCTKKGLCGDASSMDFLKLCDFSPIRIDKCSAICPTEKTCKDCMSIEGVSCAWCKNTTGSFCVDLIVTDICLTEACEPAVYNGGGGGFDGGSFVGGMFLALGLVGIAGAGYWYATRRQSYKPLN